MKVLADGNVEMFDPDANPARDCVSEQYCEVLSVRARDGKLMISPTTWCPDPAEYSYRITGMKLATDSVKEPCTGDRPQYFDGAGLTP